MSSQRNTGFDQPTIVKLPPLAPSAGGGSSTTSQPNSSASHTPPPSAAEEATTGWGGGTATSSAAATTMTRATTATPPRRNPNLLPPNPNESEPRLSSDWDPDTLTTHCTSCQSKFDPIFNRRHHCRLCGRLFCQNCSNTRSLIPPSALVLKKAGGVIGSTTNQPSFSSANDGDDSVTYVRSASQHEEDDTILYGKGLERRILLARHPQRTCHPCRAQLAPLQEELCLRNSNAMRYNYIDEGDAFRRLFNSPLAFTLGHEVRKAAYTLGNLLPNKKGGMHSSNNQSGGGGNRLGAFLSTNTDDEYKSYPPPQADPCYAPNASCKTLDPTLRNLDGMHIPAKLLQRAKGVAIVTSAKGGLGFAGFEFGTGLVVARRKNIGDSNSINGNNNSNNSGMDAWSAPSAIGIAGFAWGALLGAQVSDHVFLLMTNEALRLFTSEDGRSIQLGADVGVAIGPLGRSAEADIGASASRNGDLAGSAHGGGGIAMAPIYTYSLSKGLYAGVSLDGRMVMSRPRVNEKFYGRAISARELLLGDFPAPPAAQPLYDALKRCRVYGGEVGGWDNSSASTGFNESSHHSFGASPGSPYDGNLYGSSSDNSPFPGGGLMERLSHATGAGLPTVSSNSRHNSDSYNLSGRDEPAFMSPNDRMYPC